MPYTVLLFLTYFSSVCCVWETYSESQTVGWHTLPHKSYPLPSFLLTVKKEGVELIEIRNKRSHILPSVRVVVVGY
jgi:hypothetical protein